MSKDEMIEALYQARVATCRIVGGLNSLDVVVHPDSGWTVKDILLHIAWWDGIARMTMNAHARGIRLLLPSEYLHGNVNRFIRGEFKDYSVERTFMHFSDNRWQLIHAYERLPSRSIDEPIVVPNGGQFSVISYTKIHVNHEVEHRHQIIASLQSQSA